MIAASTVLSVSDEINMPRASTLAAISTRPRCDSKNTPDPVGGVAASKATAWQTISGSTMAI